MKMDSRKILEKYKTIAVVGCSRNENKDAHKVPKYLKENGYDIIPVNPNADRILGEKCYPSLLDIPANVARRIEIVNIFRPTDEIPGIAEQVVQFKKLANDLEVLWLQLGIYLEPDALRSKLKRENIFLVEGRCMMKDHQNLL